MLTTIFLIVNRGAASSFKTEEDLAFSMPAGLYDESFYLQIATVHINGIIHYTTDGSNPTPHSQKYTEAIPIFDRTDDPNILSAISNVAGGVYDMNFKLPEANIYKGNIIKARVFSKEGLPLSDIITKSYFVNRDYGDLVVVSLVMEETDFRDIYTTPNWQNRGREWERPVHFELFDPRYPGEGAAVSLNMGIRINGAYTRNSPMKSLRLYARREYDDQNIIKYDVFDGRATTIDGEMMTEFKRLILRNSGTDAWGAVKRCAMAQNLLRYNTAVPYQAYRQSAVFINGEFWGLYNIRERIDGESISRRYKLNSADDIVLISATGSEGGYDEEAEDNEKYEEMWQWFKSVRNGMTDEQFLEAQCYLDIDNFIDYYIFNIFVGNTDWPAGHHTLWRYRNADFPHDASVPKSGNDGRWRFHAHDLDYSFAPRTGDPNLDRTVLFNPYIYLNSKESGEEGFTFGYGKQADWGTLFWRRLVTNEQFTRLFIARYCDLLNINFSSAAILLGIEEMRVNIAPHIEEFWDRHPTFQGMQNNWRQEFPQMSHQEAYQSEIDILIDFAGRRHEIINSYTREFFGSNGYFIGESVTVTLKAGDGGHVVINDIPLINGTPGVVDVSLWSGQFFAGMEVTVTAKPDYGFSFLGWYEDGELISTEMEFSFLAVACMLEARFE